MEFVQQQRATPFRPTFDANTPDTEPGMFRLMTSCWEEDPDNRPRFNDVIRTIVRINDGRSETNLLFIKDTAYVQILYLYMFDVRAERMAR